MSDEIEALHQEIFGFVPNKPGVAYERIAAVVLAVLGWRDVTHDVLEQPPGRLAEHQLDVVARHPSGEVRRLIVECKDWNRKVGKGVLDTLVGVRNQVGADAAAVITTKEYKKGARLVAVDEDIALLRLRRFDPKQDEGTYIKSVRIEMRFPVPDRSNFGVDLADPAIVLDGPRGPDSPTTFDARISLGPQDHLLHEDGSLAEQIEQIQVQQGAPQSAGVYERRFEFDSVRVIPTVKGPSVRILALTWTEAVTVSTEVVEVERPGEPQLVFQQLDERGEMQSGRVIVDRDLYAWKFDGENRLVEEGALVEQAPIEAEPPAPLSSSS